MVIRCGGVVGIPALVIVLAIGLIAAARPVRAQDQVGSIRGVVNDKEFKVTVAAAEVRIVETGAKATTSPQGIFAFRDLPAGTYTLIFAKDGYLRRVKSDVLVEAGSVREIEIWLGGDFTDMPNYVAQDALEIGGSSEAGLLALRFESPAMIDSIGSELMSQAGASDAASALRLVAGASLQNGKSAVIRGLPDRYVSSQVNGMRLPTADEDKRAVELDQFPSAVIESLQISKTFTPNQQGDASGGAVDVRLKGIPEGTMFELKTQIGYNSNVRNRDDFLTYDGGGVNFWGRDRSGRQIQSDRLGEDWIGAVGVSEGDAPIQGKWSFAAGHAHEYDNGVRIGGFASFFYEQDASYYDDGIDDSWWLTEPGGELTPQYNQGTPAEDFKTSLFDITQGTETVQWGGLGTFGVEIEDHSIGMSYLYSRTVEDTATLAEDTRGKEYYFPGYVREDPLHEGNSQDNRFRAPYLRLETLQYTERATSTLQWNGKHRFPVEDERDPGELFVLEAPEVDWGLALSDALLDQPDKRQFGSLWVASSFVPGRPPFSEDETLPPEHFPYKPGANFNLGNLQRIWKRIEEESIQYNANVKVPFRQWTDDRGYLQVGYFRDDLEREFDQDTFSNFGDSGSSYLGEFEDKWSDVFPEEGGHPITASNLDVDYDGGQDISAYYAMMDVPLFSQLSVVGGVRFESTDISIVNIPEEEATWFPPGANAPVRLNPGDADVDYSRNDVLPAIGLEYNPTSQVTIRGSYSQTVARQTFKEITPIIQQEFLGGPLFVGNPELEMSEVENYDLRFDYRPYQGALVSTSWFYKDIKDPIEYVQRVGPIFDFTTPVNYPEGQLTGWEFEIRQDLDTFWPQARGVSVGGNATLIHSQVRLDAQEVADLERIGAPQRKREMTNAPDYLYNLYVTWDGVDTGTKVGLFYTVQGDTLLAGAGQSDNNFIPSIYATEFNTLNLSISQKLGKYLKLRFQAKNLTNPEIETVYRSDYTGADKTKSSFTRGVDYSISLSAEIPF